MTDLIETLFAQTSNAAAVVGPITLLLIGLFLVWLLSWFVKLPPRKRRDVIELIRALRRR